jgi:hypothetical protein
LIEQHASTILTVSITLNALWLLGAWLTVRASKRKWLWRSLSLMGVALAVIWTTRLVSATPAPTHTLRLPLLTINLDLAAIAWHAFILPLALLAMLLRVLVVIIKKKRSSSLSPNSEMGGRGPG